MKTESKQIPYRCRTGIKYLIMCEKEVKTIYNALFNSVVNVKSGFISVLFRFYLGFISVISRFYCDFCTAGRPVTECAN